MEFDIWLYFVKIHLFKVFYRCTEWQEDDRPNELAWCPAIYCIILFFKAGHLSLFCKIHLFIKFSITVQNDIRMRGLMSWHGAPAIYCIVLFFKAGHLSLFCKIHHFIKFSITVQNDIRMSDSFDDRPNELAWCPCYLLYCILLFF